jgi:hypothetical protein
MSLSDGFQNTALLNAGLSSGYGWDAQRRVVFPTRSHGENYLSEPWPNTNLWGGSASGSATRKWISPGAGGTGNDAQNNGVQFDTGSAVGSAVWYARVIPHLPTDYGLFMLPALTSVSAHMEDSLWLQAQNTVVNKALVMNLNASGVYVTDSAGVNHLLATHSPPYVCETWVELKANTDGTTRVRLYQGTQPNGETTVTLATGNPANAGLVMFQQRSGITPNQSSQLFQVNIGDTQLNDDCFLAWNPIQAPYDAQSVNILFAVEDVSANIVLNTDLWCDIQIHDTTFIRTHLTELQLDPTDSAALPWLGVLDFTKPVRLFCGVLPVSISQGWDVLPRVRLLNGKMGAFIGFLMQLRSIY